MIFLAIDRHDPQNMSNDTMKLSTFERSAINRNLLAVPSLVLSLSYRLKSSGISSYRQIAHHEDE